MAPPESSPLPQFYGQHLPDGTVAQPPVPPLPEPGSGESRQHLLNTPAHPTPAHIEPSTDVFSSPQLPNALHISHTPTPVNRRIGGSVDHGEPNVRQARKTQSQDFRPLASRSAWLDEYGSDEEVDVQVIRRRPSKAYRSRAPGYSNDYQSFSRYGRIPERRSFESHASHAFEKPRYEMQYSNADDAGRHRTPPGAAGGGNVPPKPPPAREVMRLPWAIWMGSNAKNHFVAFIGEFVGTTMFLFFAFSGTQVANIGSSAASNTNTTTGESTGFSPNVLLYIALVFSFSLMVNVWVFFRISGGLFNPAVTLAMLLCRALSPVRAMLLVFAQILGSIFSSYLVSVLFPTAFNVRTTLSAGTSLARGVFIEAILTAELVFTIFMLAKEKHKATFIAPVGIGLALFIAELVGVYYTGGSLNPARSFGPCVVTGIFDVEHWIYWVGPGLGAVMAVVFYQFIKILEYEVANPGQDDDKKDQEEKQLKEKSPDPNGTP